MVTVKQRDVVPKIQSSPRNETNSTGGGELSATIVQEQGKRRSQRLNRRVLIVLSPLDGGNTQKQPSWQQVSLRSTIDTYYIDQNALNTPGGLGHSVWRKIWTGHFSKGPVPPTRFGAKFEREGVPMLERMWPIQILRRTEWPKPPGVSRAFWSI